MAKKIKVGAVIVYNECGLNEFVVAVTAVYKSSNDFSGTVVATCSDIPSYEVGHQCDAWNKDDSNWIILSKRQLKSIFGIL